ncbi:nucleotide-diphospho-sugar transferase [Xylogone sp. PMI_703]|nr:nucleotide-diphospho-sugar transferase [Xylogone sp. PMI_703]
MAPNGVNGTNGTNGTNGQKKRVTESRKVWTTLITNTKYLSGLLALDYSLKKQGSKYPLVALYTDTFPPEGHTALERRGIPKQRVEYLLPTKGKDYSADPRFYDCWSKLTPFSLVEYDRVVQLDSDMLCLKNMDELMEMELDSPELGGNGQRVFAAGHACVCNPLKKPHYPVDWIPESCAFTSQHSTPDIAQHTGADPAVGPLGFMNGGLVVVNPSAVVYNRILAHMSSDAVINMDFADQSLLSDLFRGRWVPLPYVYNALKTLRWEGVHAPIWRDEEVKNIHYILSPKPWDEVDEEGNCVSEDPTFPWWVDVNKERLKHERARGIENDGF